MIVFQVIALVILGLGCYQPGLYMVKRKPRRHGMVGRLLF